MHILYIRIWEERGRHCRSKQSIKKQRTFLLSFKKSLSQKTKGGGETKPRNKQKQSPQKEKKKPPQIINNAYLKKQTSTTAATTARDTSQFVL